FTTIRFYKVSVFFFSSRRRHTRFSRDWSSDVCSSDLAGLRIPHPPALELLADDLLADLDCRVLSHSLSPPRLPAIDQPSSMRPQPPLGFRGISHRNI